MNLTTEHPIMSLILFLVLTACAPMHDIVLPPVKPEVAYDQLYPYYIDLCAVSQIRSTFAKHGGSPGHAVMYIKGACRDSDYTYPILKLCDEESADLSNPETGVGISVNKMLKNVNWLVIPGRQLFFHGNIKDGQILNKDLALATIKFAAEEGVFKGIEIHEEYKPPEKDRKALVYLIASETLGTDFALKFGRSIWCARLPITQSMVEDIIEFLNGLNHEYATGKAEYHWSGYADNCSHTLRNALAAAGVWQPKSVRTIKLMQFFNLSVPANEFADLAVLMTSFPIEDFDRIYHNEVMRRTLLEKNWLPTEPGALVNLIPVHQDNELYETGVRIFVLEGFLKRKTKRVDALYSNWRYTGLAANLRYFRERYRKILNNRSKDWNRVEPGDEYSRVKKRYYQYIEQQLADVNTKLGKLFPGYRQ